MRNHLIEVIEKYAENYDNLVVVTADLGYSVLDNFKKKFPDRFFNVGISEQNMAGVCAGLAISGFKVIMYSIGNFTTLRCLEQIRNCICYHNADVKIISIGGGFAYGALGMTHHATEDIGIMRTLPNLRIYAPASPKYAELSIEDALSYTGPCYIRLERNKEAELPKHNFNIDIAEIKAGNNVAVLSYGTVIQESLSIKNNDIGIYNVTKIKPFNERRFIDIASRYKNIITIEEHNVINGLGSLIADLIVKYNIDIHLKKIGLNDTYTSVVGNQLFLRNTYNIDSNSIGKYLNE